MTIVFFHGLNTFGDDLVHIGPIKLAAMHSRWEAVLKEKAPSCHFIPVLQLGAGTIHEQAAHALQFLQSRLLDPAVQGVQGDRESLKNLHFVGQSTGGLVARELAHHPDFKNQVRSVVTVGTPNHGAMAAEFAIDTFHNRNWLTQILRVGRYPLEKKRRVFESLTPHALASFNLKFDHHEAAPCYSLVCSLKRSQLAWPLQFFYSQIHPDHDRKSDGFISTKSQLFDAETNAEFGFLQEEFALDHFGELGFLIGHIHHPWARHSVNAVKEFDRLIEVTLQIVSSRNV